MHINEYTLSYILTECIRITSLNPCSVLLPYYEQREYIRTKLERIKLLNEIEVIGLSDIPRNSTIYVPYTTFVPKNQYYITGSNYETLCINSWNRYSDLNKDLSQLLDSDLVTITINNDVKITERGEKFSKLLFKDICSQDWTFHLFKLLVTSLIMVDGIDYYIDNNQLFLLRYTIDFTDADILSQFLRLRHNINLECRPLKYNSLLEIVKQCDILNLSDKSYVSKHFYNTLNDLESIINNCIHRNDKLNVILCDSNILCNYKDKSNFSNVILCSIKDILLISKYNKECIIHNLLYKELGLHNEIHYVPVKYICNKFKNTISYDKLNLTSTQKFLASTLQSYDSKIAKRVKLNTILRTVVVEVIDILTNEVGDEDYLYDLQSDIMVFSSLRIRKIRDIQDFKYQLYNYLDTILSNNIIKG